jgi:hypothetical protein
MHNQIRGLMSLAERLDKVTGRLERLDKDELVVTKFEGLTLLWAANRLVRQLERVLLPVPADPESGPQTN